MIIESNLSLSTIIFFELSEKTYKEVNEFFKTNPKRRICRYGFGKDSELVVRFTRKDIKEKFHKSFG